MPANAGKSGPAAPDIAAGIGGGAARPDTIMRA
jgi:hypothetical protein